MLITALAVLAACGGDSRVTLTVRADPPALAETFDIDRAVLETVPILLSRLQSFGAGDPEVTAEGRTITASFSNLDEGVARRLLLESGRLEFQQPKLDERGFVACVDANGEEFFVSPLRVNPDPAVNSPARCFGDGQLGDPLWEPTPGTTVGGAQLTLAEMIEPASWRISAEGALGPRFTDEGSELLEAVTGHLVGYPLGVFVDGALIGAPRIQRPITNGEPVISGFSELEARIRRAQLNAQPLPAAMTLVN